MRIKEVTAYEDRLDNLFAQYSSIPVDNDLLRANWSRYLCVLVSGYLEVSVRAILIAYVSDKSAPNVKRYVDRQLEALQNAKMEKIYLLVGAFSPDWATSFKSATEGELRDAVDSVVINRHRIAHGQDSGISFVVLQGYYERCKKVVNLLEQICAS